MCHSNVVEERTAGFTLIEALVALSIVAIVLSSTGALIASSAKSTRSLEARVSRLAAAKSLLSALPEHLRLLPGVTAGNHAGNQWQLDVSPFITPSDPTAIWQAQTVTLTIKNPHAGDMQVQTVRLTRREAR